MEGYFPVRLEKYRERKVIMLEKLKKEGELLNAKVTFIDGCISGSIDIRGQSASESIRSREARASASGPQLRLSPSPSNDLTYRRTITLFKVAAQAVQDKINELESSSAQQLWLRDLEELEGEYKRSFGL